MARIDEFKNKQQEKQKQPKAPRKTPQKAKKMVGESLEAAPSVHRRPGLDETPLKSVEVESVEVELSTTTENAQAEPEKPRVELRFDGSELLRATFPKAFQLADEVATDWIHGGNFEKIPVDNPMIKVLAQQGLMKAKEVETKVLTSPVTEKVLMKALTVGLKVQSFFKKG